MVQDVILGCRFDVNYCQRRDSSEATHAYTGGTGGMEFGGRLMAAHGVFQTGWRLIACSTGYFTIFAV